MGAYSMQSADGNTPLTRDTYGIAVKSKFCRVDNQNYDILKNPKTDTAEMKKSPKGMLFVYRDETHDNQIGYMELSQLHKEKQYIPCLYNIMKPYYLPAVRDDINTSNSLGAIRNRLHDGHFND